MNGQGDVQYIYNNAEENVQFMTSFEKFIQYGNMPVYLFIFLFIGFSFNHLDGQGFYGGNCGGFAGGTQMAGSSPQPHKAQEQQPRETPVSTSAQQQLFQIGEQQISRYNLRWPVENVLLCTVLLRFMLLHLASYHTVFFSFGSSETDHRSCQAQRQGPAGLLQHRGCTLPPGHAKTTLWRTGRERRHVSLFSHSS